MTDTQGGRASRRLLYTDCEVRMEEAPWKTRWLGWRPPLLLRILDDNKGQSGIDPSVEITLDVRGMPALTVLEIMMEQYEDETGEACDWQLRTGRVEVSTKERLARKGAALKRYPIQDLITDVPNFDNGPRLDLGTALAQGSQQGGGNGSQSLFQGGSDDPDLPSAAEKAEQIIELIVELVESEGWAPMEATGHPSDTTRQPPHQGQILFTGGLAAIHSVRPARPDQRPSQRAMDRASRVLATPKDEPKSREAALGKPNSLSEAHESRTRSPFRQADATRQLNRIQGSGTQDTLFRRRWRLVQIQGERPSAFVVRVDQHQSFALDSTPVGTLRWPKQNNCTFHASARRSMSASSNTRPTSSNTHSFRLLKVRSHQRSANDLGVERGHHGPARQGMRTQTPFSARTPKAMAAMNSSSACSTAS